MTPLLEQLQNAARQRRETARQAFRHHLLEGVLRRLAGLCEGDRFVLRGGMLTRAWVGPHPRPTRDLDLVGDFPFDVEDTVRRIRPILEMDPRDGVQIDPGSLSAQGIWLESQFPGVRLALRLGLQSVDQELTIDVGFGDPLVPEAEWMDYPALIPELLARVRVCRPETQVAWKLHGLAEMQGDWRPKDVADLWLITRAVPLTTEALVPAIEAAFVSRGCSIEDAPRVLSQPHWATKTARVRWATHRGSLPELPRTIADIRERLSPALLLLAPS